MTEILTDERRAFVEAIRDFCARECGTREQRMKLTGDGREAHNQALYERMAALGWVGVAIPQEYGGQGAGMVDACLFMEETTRGLAPIGCRRRARAFGPIEPPLRSCAGAPRSSRSRMLALSECRRAPRPALAGARGCCGAGRVPRSRRRWDPRRAGRT